VPLRPQENLKVFDKWAIDFVGPINPLARKSRERYIITTKKYLTKWVEATTVRYCNTLLV
jgi:hypothetical protein